MSRAKQKTMEIDLLHQLLGFNPETGEMWWRERPLEMFKSERECRRWNTRYAGNPAFTAPHSAGCREGKIFGTKFKAHRVIWALHHGAWPEEGIDHVNGDPSDNRIANLREADQTKNGRNASLRRDNKSGHVGVYASGRRANPWLALITVAGKSIFLGHFATKEEAIAARKAAEVKYGFHENHGRAA